MWSRAFSPEGADDTLGDRVGARRPKRRDDVVDPDAFGSLVAIAPVDGISIAHGKLYPGRLRLGLKTGLSAEVLGVDGPVRSTDFVQKAHPGSQLESMAHGRRCVPCNKNQVPSFDPSMK